MGLSGFDDKFQAHLTFNRKIDHLRICLNRNVSFMGKSTGFNDVELVHRALPEIDFDEISLETSLLGHRLKAPIIISAMTGGSRLAMKINEVLARVAEELGIGMGVGSQRVALENPDLSPTFSIVREVAPTAFLIANLGAAQFSLGFGLDEARRAVEMINADALAIHLNPLQEIVQREGEPKFSGVLSKIGELVDGLDVPLIVKETGAGISMEVAFLLERVGVKCVDVGGAGGTSWAAVEYYRALEANDDLYASLAKLFWDWGIPTVISVCEVGYATDLEIIATGGVRSGLDVAKAIALGASSAGIALPLLRPAYDRGVEGVLDFLNRMILELKATMFLVGAKSISDLRRVPLVIGGFTAEWLKLRGVKLEVYSRRIGNV